jgi:hypothetical protein
MVTVSTSLPKQRYLPKLEVGKNLALVLEKAKMNLDRFIEYPPCGGKPGSSEANWVPIDWFGAKIEGILKKRGERV